MPLPGPPKYQTSTQVLAKLPKAVLDKAAAERAIFDAELKKKQEQETAEAQAAAEAKLAAEAQAAHAKSANARQVKPRPLSAHASEFATLKIHPSSSMLEIRKAYLKLAMKTHPDKNGNTPETTTAFQKIQAAYETLTKPQKNGGSKRRICRMYRKTKKTHRRTKHCRKTQNCLISKK
jgi:hypothetical protein